MAKEAPGAFGYHWFQQKGTKGAVGVLVVDHWLTIAPVRMLRMSFL
jgi:lysyl-tRNA synthetase class I